MRVGGAVLGLLLAGSAFAGEAWKLQLLGCSEEEPAPRPGLAEALELELGAPDDPARFAVRVRWPCGAEAVAVVSVEDVATRLETRVELGATPPELWDRVIALVARQLLHDARRIAQASAQTAASPSAPPPPEPPVTRQAEPPPGPAAAPAPSSSDWALRAAPGGRIYPARPTLTVGGSVEGAWRWVRLGLSFDWTRVEPALARIDGLAVAAQLGAMPFRFRQEYWQIGVGAYLEGGVAHSSTHPKVSGYRGTQATAPLAGAAVRTELGFRPSPRWAITLSLDVGYDIGLRVNVLTLPAADLRGTFLVGRLGLEL